MTPCPGEPEHGSCPLTAGRSPRRQRGRERCPGARGPEPSAASTAAAEDARRRRDFGTTRIVASKNAVSASGRRSTRGGAVTGRPADEVVVFGHTYDGRHLGNSRELVQASFAAFLNIAPNVPPEESFCRLCVSAFNLPLM
jgi:hypothetical protein